MGVGAGLSMYVVVVQKFTFAISSPDEFLLTLTIILVASEVLTERHKLHVFMQIYLQGEHQCGRRLYMAAADLRWLTST